mgnify:CR=1 FL=1
MAASSETFFACSPNQLLHLSDRIQGVIAEILSHHPEQMDVCLCLHVLHPFSYHDVAAIQWSEISTAALLQAGYVVVGGSFLAYIFIMSAQRLLRPTVVSMYNYMQPIVASTVAIILGLGVFNLEKGISHSLGIPGSVHRDTKQVTQGFRERRESRIKQPFHRHSTPARTRLRDSGVINR